MSLTHNVHDNPRLNKLESHGYTGEELVVIFFNTKIRSLRKSPGTT